MSSMFDIARGVLAARIVLALLLCLGLTGQPAAWAAGSRPHLVSTAWLQQNLSRPEVLLIDASPGPVHLKAHIPGAVHADLMNFGVLEQAPAAMEERMRSWGLTRGRKVVLYDGDGMMWAARMFFELVHLGYPAEDVALLDGGLAKWVATGGAVTQTPTPKPAPGTFSVGPIRDELLARLPEFVTATGQPQRTVVVDALTPDYHFGARKYFDRGGHVPNAVLLPRTDFFNEDQTFKSPAQLRQMLDHLGIGAERPVISYCGGGVAAAVPFFAMKFMLGHKDVKLYRGSQLEWLRDDRTLPMWSYSAPHLVREIDWLKNWGQGFLRQMGIARVQVVDVRSAELYAQGHLAGSHHISIGALRAAANDSVALARLLAPLQAGKVVGHETVVVSTAGGVNPESALALLVLEAALGTPVSILGGSIDEWALRGLPLTKSQEVRAAPGAAVMAPGMRPALRPAAASAAVTIASGMAAPPDLAGGRVVHLHYRTLLAPDGQPRPASEMWAEIEKAGVPRYTPLVLTAEDIGEAAVNYVLLKMMGFTALTVHSP